MSDLMSLYEYLHRAAGPEVGMEVYKAFKREYPKEEPATRPVNNKKYTGKVRLYPKDFLDRYFGKK